MSAIPLRDDIFNSLNDAAEIQLNLGLFYDFIDQRLAAGTATAAEKAATRAALETSRELQPIDGTVSTNALTLTLNPTNLEFRSATITSGAVLMRAVAAAISVVISSGSTLGTTSAVASRVAILAIDNAGTVELAAVNADGGFHFDESQLISTTAEGGAGGADSASVVYSTTARSNVAFRFVGLVYSTQVTAGVWATTPSKKQGAGGLIRAALTSCVSVGTANGHGSTNVRIRRFTTTHLSRGADITYADSATLGATFTINTSGVYAISYVDSFSVASTLGASVNSNQLTTEIPLITQANRLFDVSTPAASARGYGGITIPLLAGDVVRAHTIGDTNGSATASTIFTITKVA